MLRKKKTLGKKDAFFINLKLGRLFFATHFMKKEDRRVESKALDRFQRAENIFVFFFLPKDGRVEFVSLQQS